MTIRTAAHIPTLPNSFHILKYIQLGFATLLLPLSAFNVAVLAYNAHAYAIFVALYVSIPNNIHTNPPMSQHRLTPTLLQTIGITIYHIVCLHSTPQSYHWIAVLVLEIVALIFWLSCWAVLAALYAVLVLLGSSYDYGYYYTSYKRDLDLEKRMSYEYSMAYTGCLIASLAFSVVNLCVPSCPSKTTIWS